MTSRPEFFADLPILREAQVALASASPRRRELLARLMPPDTFRIISADIDESRRTAEAPVDYVIRLALEKAEAGSKLWLAANPSSGTKLIIAADTSVVLGDIIYGKPSDPQDTARMLSELAGRTHTVITGFAARLLDASHKVVREESNYCSTEVEIRNLSKAEIEWYIATGEPQDKAGAYAVQGYGGTLVSSVRGDYYNVVGLPLVPLIEMLRSFEV
ncbi:MAG TPA: Maf family protein [Chloroflexia bacterium]|nr:Maf family protein [Chloroflexia bacterium]